jgi:hypothetical protein
MVDETPCSKKELIDVFNRRLVRCGEVGICDLVKDIRRIEIVRSTKEKTSVNTQEDKKPCKKRRTKSKGKIYKIKEDSKCRLCIETKF